MAQRLRQLLEAKQQLLRDVSHELRSPLTRLQLALSLARRAESGAERHLARVASEADRLELLIARTLELVRLERPANALEHIRVDVGELLCRIGADVGIEADARGCRVEMHAGSLIVSGDPELLRSAFENVLRNAVRYSPAATVVGISARRVVEHPEHRVQVSIRDHGPGVPEQDLASIFEPFYRVDAARDRAGGGEGLGLAIAAGAVAVHRGRIVARNAQGAGLLVSITLPALQPERAYADSRAIAPT